VFRFVFASVKRAAAVVLFGVHENYSRRKVLNTATYIRAKQASKHGKASKQASRIYCQAENNKRGAVHNVCFDPFMYAGLGRSAALLLHWLLRKPAQLGLDGFVTERSGVREQAHRCCAAVPRRVVQLVRIAWCVALFGMLCFEYYFVVHSCAVSHRYYDENVTYVRTAVVVVVVIAVAVCTFTLDTQHLIF
jgi:hypothetical protein